MYEWLFTLKLTEEEKNIPLDEWLKIICDFAYNGDLKNFSKNDANNMKKRREQIIQILKNIALKNNSDFNRAEFKNMTLS